MRRNHLIAAAGVCFALIVYATLARLAWRPVLIGHHEAYWVVVIERFSAYGLLGFLLSFLLPGRLTLACSLVVAVAMGLEILQAMTPDRDPGLRTDELRPESAPELDVRLHDEAASSGDIKTEAWA